MHLKVEAILGMIAAVVGIAGVIFLAPGPNKEDPSPLRPGWVLGLVLVGLAFFWFGAIGVLD